MFMILLPVPKKETRPIFMYCSLPAENKDDASKYAKVFLEKIGEASEALDSCKFCHSEKADA